MITRARPGRKGFRLFADRECRWTQRVADTERRSLRNRFLCHTDDDVVVVYGYNEIKRKRNIARVALLGVVFEAFKTYGKFVFRAQIILVKKKLSKSFPGCVKKEDMRFVEKI